MRSSSGFLPFFIAAINFQAIDCCMAKKNKYQRISSINKICILICSGQELQIVIRNLSQAVRTRCLLIFSFKIP